MSATNNRRSVAEILTAIKAALAAAQWTPEGGDPVTAFPEVKLFDIADLEKAFTELISSTQRVCFVIADNEEFAEALDSSHQLMLTRRLPVAILLSDRVHGDRITALYGGVNGTTPILGAEGMKEIALEAVTGQLLDNPAGVVCKPTTSAIIQVADTKSKLPGRACVELDVECTGGTLEADLSAGPNV